jgi:hypothetical protein
MTEPSVEADFPTMMTVQASDANSARQETQACSSAVWEAPIKTRAKRVIKPSQ